jgi:hypothetical protein
MVWRAWTRLERPASEPGQLLKGIRHMARFIVRPGWLLKVRLSEVDDQASALFNHHEILRVQIGQENEFQQQVNPGDVLEISLSDTHRPFFGLRYQLWLGPHVGGYPIVDAEIWGNSLAGQGPGPHPAAVFGEMFRRQIQFTA